MAWRPVNSVSLPHWSSLTRMKAFPDGNGSVVTGARERRPRVKVVLLKNDIASAAAVTPGLLKVIGAQIQRRDPRGGKLFGQEPGNASRPAAEFEQVPHRDLAFAQFI